MKLEDLLKGRKKTSHGYKTTMTLPGKPKDSDIIIVGVLKPPKLIYTGDGKMFKSYSCPILPDILKAKGPIKEPCRTLTKQ